MKTTRSFPTALLGLLAGLLAAAPGGAEDKRAQKTAAPLPPDAVAVVAGEPVRAGQLEEQIKGPLLDLRMKEYTLRSRALDEIIARMLMEREAAARGVSVAELSKAEVDDKAAVTEEETRAFYEANKARFPNLAEADALAQIRSSLQLQRARERRGAFVRELRARAGVRVLLEPVRVTMEPGDHPSRGPAAAPVTLVEFSDFQCPYCARVRPSLKRVRETYGDKVRFVFRDFPLQQIHPQAAKAAEAAACAGEQDKFWEMHDRLFENQSRLQVTDLKQHGTELGLDAEKFGECLDSGRRAADWQRDLSEGSGYGVTGTPAFFINGRMLVGAQPYEAFAQVIEEELERAASRAEAVK